MAEKRENEMTREEVIQEMAKAAMRAFLDQNTKPHEGAANFHGPRIVDAALAAASRAGFVLVPREASDAMIKAARADGPYYRGGGHEVHIGDHVFEDAWSAMLAEAEKR